MIKERTQSNKVRAGSTIYIDISVSVASRRRSYVDPMQSGHLNRRIVIIAWGVTDGWTEILSCLHRTADSYADTSRGPIELQENCGEYVHPRLKFRLHNLILFVVK